MKIKVMNLTLVENIVNDGKQIRQISSMSELKDTLIVEDFSERKKKYDEKSNWLKIEMKSLLDYLCNKYCSGISSYTLFCNNNTKGFIVFNPGLNLNNKSVFSLFEDIDPNDIFKEIIFEYGNSSLILPYNTAELKLYLTETASTIFMTNKLLGGIKNEYGFDTQLIV